jgi:hypothetical protein
VTRPRLTQVQNAPAWTRAPSAAIPVISKHGESDSKPSLVIETLKPDDLHVVRPSPLGAVATLAAVLALTACTASHGHAARTTDVAIAQTAASS